MERLAHYVDHLQQAGRYTFTRAEAELALGGSMVAVQSAARRLRKQGRIAIPRRGFFVIVPLEYRTAGAPPPTWFVDDFMRHMKRPYYVGVLSAAALHGAAHQQPQELQVITDRRMRPAVAGRSRLRFIYKQRVDDTPVESRNTPTGTMLVSTPEATMFDLVRYVHAAGSLSNVATVLHELAEQLDDPQKLVEAAGTVPDASTVQRAGWLLEEYGDGVDTQPLADWLRSREPSRAALAAGRPATGCARSTKWNLVVNERPEPDL